MRIAILALLLLTGCSTTKDAEVPEALLLFEEAMGYVEDKNPIQAKLKLEQFRAQFPWSIYTEHVSLELIYVYVKADDFEEALSLINEVQTTYAEGDQPDYLIYAKGYVLYMQNKASFEDYIFTDISQRSISSANQSFDTFKQLLLLYPDSKYAPNAAQRMVYMRNLFAEKELDVAKFYLQEGAYLACTSRSSLVLTDFISTPHVPEAVALLKECAQKGGLDALAKEAEVLQQQLLVK